MEVTLQIEAGLENRVKQLQRILSRKRNKKVSIEEVCLDLVDDCVDIWIEQEFEEERGGG